jgi:D-alanyl-D-alanine carboxypeptidase
MSKPVRFGSAVSLAVISSMMVAGCAASRNGAETAGSTKANGDFALAVRAAAALNSNDYATAVSLAERAAAKTPQDATVRALLGNAYFASGRFASAEAAYKDALFVESNQPGVILKLVLVEIAQGKTADALNFLEAGKGVLDPADYGLALALAGRPEAGVAALEPSARAQGADARVRENLALAYALSGDWTNARTIAAQDVPADQLDNRIHQWMQLASPHRPSDQVAALVGVQPAASDPGQPVELALNKSDTRLAAVVPAPVPASAVTVALPPAQPVQMAAADTAPAPVAVAFHAPTTSAAAPLVDLASLPVVPPRPAPAVQTSFAAIVARSPVHAPVRLSPRKAALIHEAADAPSFAAVRNGRSGAVVQLGAYGNPQRVAAAWNTAARKFGGLKHYTPLSARFDSAHGTVYRLAVRGFGSFGEANALCASLRRSGGTCFVRNFAGDAPVQFAMR